MTSLLFDADDDDDELSATTLSFDETSFDVSNDTVDDIFSFKMSSVTTEKDYHPLVTISRTKIRVPALKMGHDSSAHQT